MDIQSGTNKLGIEEARWYDSLWPWILIIFGIQAAYWVAVIVYFHCCHQLGDANQNWTNAGTFGDLFGGLSCLFSGFAFAGLIVTIRQQSREIRLQIREQQDTRKEFEAQTKQFEEQNRVNKLQEARADIYRRIELLKSLENEVLFCYHQRLVTDLGQTLIHEKACSYKGIQAINVMSDLFMKYEKILFKNKTPTKGDFVQLGDFANDMYMAYISLQPFMVSLGDLLRDVKTYFVENPDEILRQYRLVLNAFNVHVKRFLVIYKGFCTDAKLIHVLIEKGYIPADVVGEGLLCDDKQMILADWLLKNISAEEARNKLAKIK